MARPSFIAEMARPEHRSKLWFGVWSGYAIAAALGAVALAAVLFGVMPYAAEFAIMLGAKVVTNTIVLVALRRGAGRAAVDLMGVNMLADGVIITAAIYYTGGPASPLIALYVIEVTVTALLSNVGVTILTAVGNLLAYAVMCGLVAGDVLPLRSPLGVGTIDFAEAVVYVGYTTLAVGIPTAFALRILASLRDKEVALETRTADLIEAGKQRSVFLASVTHELRTPIHGVQGLADLIAAGVYGPVTDKQGEAAASIKRSAQSLLHLIDDLLALVRADVGRLDVKAGAVDLRVLVEQVVASVQWMLGTKRLQLVTEVDPAPPEAVSSDRRLLGHILINLVANAAKFTPEGGTVTVRARLDDGVVVLQVQDTGIGIPDDKRQAIFEAFRQIDGTDERTYGGVGLGLSLVKRLCDLLGGRVEVDSVVREGSTFTVYLPARVDVPHEEIDEEAPTRLRGKEPGIRGVTEPPV